MLELAVQIAWPGHVLNFMFLFILAFKNRRNDKYRVEFSVGVGVQELQLKSISEDALQVRYQTPKVNHP